MEGAPLWLIVVSSATVGALVSSVITLIGQIAERRARTREMLLKAAIDHAWRTRDHFVEMLAKTGTPATIADPVITAEVYYQWLDHLHRKGKLPDHPRVVKARREMEEATAAEKGSDDR